MVDRLMLGARDILQHRRRTVFASLAVLLGVAALFYYWQSEPSYDFKLKTVDEPVRIEQVMALARDLRTIRDWQPFYFQDPSTNSTSTQPPKAIAKSNAQPKPTESMACIHLLADWIQKCTLPPDPEKPGRFLVPEGADPRDMLLRRSTEPTFQITNGMVKLLPKVSASDLRSWREDTREDLVKELAAHFRKIRQQERDEAYAKLLALPANARLLKELESPDFPQPAAWHQRLAKSVFFNSGSSREHWVDQFLAEVNDHIRPVALFREAIVANSQVVYGQGQQTKLVFRTSVNNDAPAIHFADRESTTHMKVLLHEIASPDGSRYTADREWDTGIRLHAVRWRVKDSSTQRLYPETPADLQPTWPTNPHETSLDTGILRETLAEMGFPKQIELKDCQLDLSGDHNKPHCRLKFVCRHPDLPDFADQRELAFRIAEAGDFGSQVARLSNDVRKALANHVGTLNKWRDWPATFKPVTQGASEFHAQLTIPALGMPISLDAHLDRQGRMNFASLPPVEQRQALTTKLLESRKDWTATANPPVLEKIVLNSTETMPVICSWVRVEGDTPMRHVLIVDPFGKTRWSTFTVDEKKATSPHMMASSVPLPQATVDGEPLRMDEATCRQQIQAMLDKNYGRFPTPPTATVMSTSAGLWLTLGVRIHDYPELTLGPKLMPMNLPPEETARQMLSAKNLRQVSRDRWGADRTWSHPYYGRVMPEIETYDPANGLVTIQCKQRAFETEEGKTWPDEIRARDGRWMRSGPPLRFREMIFDGMEVAALQLFRKLPAIQRLAARGLILTIQRDKDSLKSGEEFSVSPPLMAFKVTIGLPLMGLQVDLRGIRYDEEGLHFPEQPRVSIIGTFYLPHLCLSDPVLQFDFKAERPGVAIAGKITPPIPGLPLGFSRAPLASQLAATGVSDAIPDIRTDNLWLHAIYLQTEFSGHLAKQDPNDVQLELQAQARVRLLDAVTVAEGRLQCRPFQPWFGGDVEAAGRIPGLDYIPARLGGSLELDGRTGQFMMQAGADVFGQNILHLRLATNPSTTGSNSDNIYLIAGQVKIPGELLSLSLKGQANGNFKRYKIDGAARLGPLQIVVRIDHENGAQCYKSLNLGGSPFSWLTSEAIFGVNMLDTMNQDVERIQNQKSLFSEKYEITTASSLEENTLRNALRIPDGKRVTFELPKENTGIDGEGDDTGVTGYVQYTGFDTRQHPDNPHALRIVKLRPRGTGNGDDGSNIDYELASLNIASIADRHTPANASYRVLVNDTKGHAIITMHDGQRGTMYVWHSAERTEVAGQPGKFTYRGGSFTDLTNEYPPDILANELTRTTPTLPHWFALDQTIFCHAKETYFARNVRELDVPTEPPSTISKVDIGYQYSVKGNQAPESYEYVRYFWPCNHKKSANDTVLKSRVNIVTPWVTKNQITPALLARIRQEIGQGHDGSWAWDSARKPYELIASSGGDQAKLAWLTAKNRTTGEYVFWTASGHQRDEIELQPACTRPNIDLTNRNEQVSQEVLYRGANLLARAIFSGHAIRGKAFAGPQGVLVEQDAGYWWIIRDRGPDIEPECVQIDRNKFNNWSNAETLPLLCPDWQVSSKRQAAANNTIIIAEQVLAKYERRGSGGFDANPIGLLIGLAAK